MHNQTDMSSAPETYTPDQACFKAGDSVLSLREQQGHGWGFGQRKVISVPQFRDGLQGETWYYQVSQYPAFMFAESQLVHAWSISLNLPRNARHLLQRAPNGTADIPRHLFDGTLPSEDVEKLMREEKVFVKLHAASNKHTPDSTGRLQAGDTIGAWDSYWFWVAAMDDDAWHVQLVTFAIHKAIAPVTRERLYNYLCAKALESRAAYTIAKLPAISRDFVQEQGFNSFELRFWRGIYSEKLSDLPYFTPMKRAEAYLTALKWGLYEERYYNPPNDPFGQGITVSLTRLGMFVLQALRQPAAQE